MIVVNGLTKDFGSFRAVDQLNFQVPRGELTALLGPNGAGKTTTMRLLMGMLVPGAGRACISGLDCNRDRTEVKRHVGYLPDSPVFFEYLTGREVVAFAAELHGIPRTGAYRRADELLERFDLASVADEYAVHYSTGMQKKLALACALVHDPEVWILDEPANGLDPRAAREVDDLLRGAVADGKTVFLSTHLLDRAERLSARALIIDNGKIVASGTAEELRRQLRSTGTLEDLYLQVTAGADTAEPATGAA